MDVLLNISWYISKLSSNIPCTALEKSVGGHFLQPKTSLQTLWTHFCWWFFFPTQTRWCFFWVFGWQNQGRGNGPHPRCIWPIWRGCTFESPAWFIAPIFCLVHMGNAGFLSLKNWISLKFEGETYLVVFKIGSENHLTKRTGMVEPRLFVPIQVIGWNFFFHTARAASLYCFWSPNVYGQ